MTDTWSPPPGDGLSAVTVGDRWDVLAGPASISAPFARTTAYNAGHILHTAADRCMWLIPLGGTTGRPRDWEEISRYISLVSHGTVLPLPHAERTHASHTPRWVRDERHDVDYVADASRLVGNMRIATLHLGPPATVCELCPSPLWPGEDVRVIIPTRPRGPISHSASVHQSCAERAGLRAPVTAAEWEQLGL